MAPVLPPQVKPLLLFKKKLVGLDKFFTNDINVFADM